MEKCPICGQNAYSPTATEVSLPETLRRWEDVMGHAFPEKVWDDYKEYEHRPLVLNECHRCGFGRFEPVLPGSAEFYECISATDYYNGEKWEFSSALDTLKRNGATRILDVGCGSGIFLDYLKKNISSADLVGYDLNSELLSALSSRGFGVISGDSSAVRKLSDKLPAFDAICMFQVLEHVRDPVCFLQTFLGLLRPGGLMIITTPDTAGPIKNFPEALTEIPPHHVTKWTEASFRVLLRNNFLKVDAVRFEPLPDYLWDSYLPVMWDEPIWPKHVFDPLALHLGLRSPGERSGFAAKAMKEAGIRFLYGVPGHTIFISATLENPV